MSVIFDAAADRLLRTTNLPTGQFTVSFWVYLISDLNAYSAFWYMGGDNYGGSYAYIGTNSNGTTLIDAAETAGTNLSTGTWYYIAYAHQSGASQRGYTYLGTLTTLAAQDIQTGLNPAQPSTTRMEFGAVGTGNNDRANIRIANIKIWSTQLSLAQVQAEQFSIIPTNFTNLVGWYPCFPGSGERARDYSGLGYNWTEGGTLTDEHGPPISYGAGSYLSQYIASGGGSFNQSVSSSIGISSALLRANNKVLSSSVSPISNISRFIRRILSSNISTSSILSTSGEVLKIISSSITATTTLARVSRKTLISSLSPNGIVSKISRKILSSISTFNSGYGLRFYGTGSGNIDRARLPLDTGGVSTAIDVGADDFTIESWIQFDRANNTANISGGDARNSNIFWDRDIWGHPRGWVVGLTGTGTTRNVCFGMAETGGGWATITGTTNVGDGLKHHVAITFDQSTRRITLWVDGVNNATRIYDQSNLSYPDSYDPGAGQNNPYLVLGAEKHDAGSSYPSYNGLMDELRISNIIRYSSTFTPEQIFTVDANTLGLYHMNEVSGTTLIDAAGNVNGQLLVGGINNGPQYTSSNIFNSLLISRIKVLISSITPNTSIIKTIKKYFTSSIGITSIINKVTRKIFSGNLLLTSDIDFIGALFKALTSSIGMSTVIQKNTTKLIVGNVNITSTINRIVQHLLASATTVSSNITKNTRHIFSASISSSTNLVKSSLKYLVSGISTSSSIKNLTLKILSGIITPSGTLIKTTQKFLSSSFNLVSDIEFFNYIIQILSSGISLSSNLIKATNKNLVSNLSITSIVNKFIKKLLVSSISLLANLISNSSVLPSTTGKSTVSILDKLINHLNLTDSTNQSVYIEDTLDSD